MTQPNTPQAAPQTEAQYQQERRIRVERLVGSLLRSDASASSVLTWTPQNIRSEQLPSVIAALTVVDADIPSLTNRIVPRGMSIETFHNMLLIEMNRRDARGDNAWDQYYLPAVMNEGRDSPAYIAAARNNQNRVNFSRLDLDLGGSSNTLGTSRPLHLRPMEVAVLDAAVRNILFDVPQEGMPINNNPSFVLQNDVTDALGLPRLPNNMGRGTRLTDVGRRTLGYALGSESEFNPLNSNNQMDITLTPGITFGEMQPAYCRVVQDMYREGDQLNPRDATITGFIQGRINQRPPMSERTDAAIGITGPCPTPTIPQRGAPTPAR